MNLKKILQQAFYLTTNKPSLWVFGLILLGGFNLYLINFFAINTHHQWRELASLFAQFMGSKGLFIAYGIIVLLVCFLLMNLVKLNFIVIIHNLLHKIHLAECSLCDQVKNNKLSYEKNYTNLIITSAITIGLTIVITMLARVFLIGGIGDFMFPVILNIVIVLATTTLLGVWNLFTSYFIVIHNLNFPHASKLTIDLIILKLKSVVEFVILLCLIYFVATIVGNAFINIWNHAFLVANLPFLRFFALLAFVVWFAINNVFFNIAILIFFMELVKSVKAPQSGHIPVNVVN